MIIERDQEEKENKNDDGSELLLDPDDHSIGALIKRTGTEAMHSWSDGRRKDFCALFKSRAQRSLLVLCKTAAEITEQATRRRFISQKHVRSLEKEIIACGGCPRHADWDEWCRISQEASELAEERADEIMRSLPPLKKAIEVIDPTTSKMMDDLDKLLLKAKKLKDQLDVLSEPMVMSELDQKMSIGEFMTLVKDRQKSAKRLTNELDEIATEGSDLQTKVDRSLYKGVPGLSEAVVQSIVDCYDKARALEGVVRRVEERVMFGDSDAALKLLEHFESDELKSNNDIQEKFKAALDALRVPVQQSAKKKNTKKVLLRSKKKKSS